MNNRYCRTYWYKGNKNDLLRSYSFNRKQVLAVNATFGARSKTIRRNEYINDTVLGVSKAGSVSFFGTSVARFDVYR